MQKNLIGQQRIQHGLPGIVEDFHDHRKNSVAYCYPIFFKVAIRIDHPDINVFQSFFILTLRGENS